LIHKVIICGERTYREIYAKPIIRTLKSLVKAHGRDNLLIIEGGAPGVDSMVRKAAYAQGIHVAEIEALWSVRGVSAGPQRNKVMAALDPDEVIGIHVDISHSSGTADMLKLADRRKIPYRLIEP
jgi:YspA, cpYpsA-related SLOG family